MARQRHGKMRHLWKAKQLHINLRIRLYVASVCSILTYGSEAWSLTPEACKRLNGANSRMLSTITGKTQYEEASEGSRTVDLVRWIRARRLQWLGHILRMEDTRLIKKAVQHLFEEPAQVGDFLMDAPQVSSWDELCERAQHREAWRTRVRELKMHNRITKVEMRRSVPTRRNPDKKYLHSASYPNTRSKMRAIAATKNSQPPAHHHPTTQPTAPRNTYVQRDEHEIFFRPATKNANLARAARAKQNRKAKKPKTRTLTDKERADAARRHWAENYGNATTNADESDKWAAAAVIPDSSMEADITQPSTPQSAKFHGQTNPSVSDHTHNFSLTLSPIVSEADKTFFLNIDSEWEE